MIKKYQSSNQKAIIFFYADVALLLFIISHLSYKSINSFLEKEQLVQHKNQVIYACKEVLLALNEAETSQRGYLLSSDSLYLKNYKENLQRARLYIDSLDNLTHDNPLQQERVKALRQQTEEKTASMNQSVDWKISLLLLYST